ncbi:cellular tumor antigen p53-like [Rhopalosiphum padi]|uniref:cellular tumor antigen p53-like n=1 Tax=Rhopalosiphum padi TaxID=40932 RepID=UPI00298DEA9F|nr:cellular tumor antigen p53-like [Rhopalosiphum padi]
MDTIKFEKEDVSEVDNSEAETESPSFSEESESSYQHLRQTGLQICTEDYPGQFNFNFYLDVTEMSKRHWMYSETLNKVYIDMNRVLPIQFQWQFDDIGLVGLKSLQIRALPIFADSEFQQLSVKRCPIHIMQDKLCDRKKKEHILWCEQSDAIYEQNHISQRHSVIAIVHNFIPCSDFKTYNVLYKFMCKSSCSMSLSRRPIYIIFTLETLNGQVLGRKKIGVKVCSCPRRDMLKEEEIEKKRIAGVKIFKKRTSLTDDNEIPGKKLKTNNDNTEDKIYELPPLPILGKRLYLSTLELLHGHFLGSAVREDCLIDSHPLISMLSDLISQVKSENNNHNKAESENP